MQNTTKRVITALPSIPAARSVRATGESPLTPDQIRRVAPSIFTGGQHGRCSDQYRCIPTIAILEELAGRGFHPYEVAQSQSRDENKRTFGKHRVRLRHESETRLSATNQIYQEIVLINSHDGTSSYRMMGGQFRQICANGMIVSEGVLPSVRVKHTGNVTEGVLDGCQEILRGMPLVAQSVRSMQSLVLSPDEQVEFARAALRVRYGDSQPPVTADQILKPRRQEDHGPDLWRTMNRVQESLMRGGITYVQRPPAPHLSDARVVGHRLLRNKTRAVNGIGQNTNLNRAIWQLAEELIARKA